MGHFSSRHPTMVALMILQVIAVLICIAGFAVSFTYENKELAERFETWGSNNNPEAVKLLMAMLRNLMLAASISGLVVFGVLGLPGVCMKLNVMTILFIIGSALTIVICAVCGVIPFFVGGVLNTRCAVIQTTCYNCPPGTAVSTCEAGALAANENCYYYTDDYHALCVSLKSKINFSIGAFFIIAILSFIASIVGCIGLSAEKKHHHHSHTEVHTTTVYGQPPIGQNVAYAKL